PKYVPLSSTKIVDGVTKTVFELKKFDFVMIQQEISSIALWNPVTKIILASSLLPIQSTQTSLPKDVGSSNNSFTGTGNNSNLFTNYHGLYYSNGWQQPVQTDGRV
ncbi:MAG: hypothetical protein ACKPKO_56310, partial [Candidatus Fonsibacter sp.]